jgi:hypothetical protein
MINSENFTVIDGTRDIEEQQYMVRKQVLKVLNDKKTSLRGGLDKGKDTKVVTKSEIEKDNQ